MNGVQRFHCGRHGKSGPLEDRLCHSEGPQPPFHNFECFVCLYDTVIIQDRLKSKPVNSTSCLNAHHRAGVGPLPSSPHLEWLRLPEKDSEHHAGIQIGNQR